MPLLRTHSSPYIATTSNDISFIIYNTVGHYVIINTLAARWRQFCGNCRRNTSTLISGQIRLHNVVVKIPLCPIIFWFALILCPSCRVYHFSLKFVHEKRKCLTVQTTLSSSPIWPESRSKFRQYTAIKSSKLCFIQSKLRSQFVFYLSELIHDIQLMNWHGWKRQLNLILHCHKHDDQDVVGIFSSWGCAFSLYLLALWYGFHPSGPSGMSNT